MSSKILITGGSGLIGRMITKKAQEKGYKVAWLSTRKIKNAPCEVFLWNPETLYVDPFAFKEVGYIINLAGAGVADKRWTKERKLEIKNSRVKSAQTIIKCLESVPHSIKQIITASATGYYGTDKGESVKTEEDQPGDDFLAEVTVAWDKATDQFKNLGILLTRLRIGVVLAKEGGALPQLATPVKWFVGAPIGSGKQFMPWIHAEDLVNMFLYCIESEIEGTYNAVAPEHVDNKTMTKLIGKVLKRPVFFPHIPALVLRIILGEMGEMVTKGVKVSGNKIQQKGFTFKYINAESALQNLLL